MSPETGRRAAVPATTVAVLLSSTQARSQSTQADPAARLNVKFNDNLAVPTPANPSLGKGKDRALALGGGGEYFAAWMLGFFYGFNASGVPYEAPDVIVGTSAGSVMGSMIAGGHLMRLTKQFDFFGRFPKLLSDLVRFPTPIRARSAHVRSARLSTTPASKRSRRSAAAPWRHAIRRRPSCNG
jgi:NTE family protein